MKRLYTRKGFGIVVILVDLLIIYLSILLSYFLFENNLESYSDNFYAFIYISPYIGICYLILNHIFELDRPRDFTLLGVGYSISLAIICLFFATMAISFLARKFAYPRSVLIVSSVLQIIFLTLWHVYVNRNYLKENVKQTILIVGYEKSKQLAYKLLRSKGIWSKVKKICEPDSQRIKDYIKACDVIFISEDVDEIKKQAIVEFCIDNNKSIFYEPKNKEILLFNTTFTQVDDMPILKVKSMEIGSGNLFFKRFIDVFLCAIAVLIFLIPGLIVSIILKIGGGSVIYKQERVTRNGRIFNIYKFRTMIENAEAVSGPTLAQETDNRITKLGHILRSTRLDEIPQLYNILRGDMSIVGPRPERPYFVDQFRKEIPEYDLRHRVKAGLTGLAQIQGKYNTPVRDKLKYDLLYINGYSLALDVKLIMQTLNILLRKSSTEGVSDINYEEEINKLYKDNREKDE